jgi:cytochrome c oxidase cbb3-type subunit 3
MSIFWSGWVIVLTLTNLALLFWLLMANRRRAVVGKETDEAKTTGHVYDGIEEYDNPLPRWWFGLFLATFIFAFGYLIAYPGLGLWKGLFGWTEVNQLQGEQERAQAKYDEVFGVYAKTSIPDLAKDPKARKMGQRLFLNNCAVCHGSDARGNPGFPNLSDTDWLYGGTPERIEETITKGRQALMPVWGPILGETNIANVTEFVLKRAGLEHDETKAAAGETVFAQNCAACHGADGKGNQMLGAPNLTDDVWLYGGEPQVIRQTIRGGRKGVMPAHESTLKPERIHLLAAYVYSLSQNEATK